MGFKKIWSVQIVWKTQTRGSQSLVIPSVKCWQFNILLYLVLCYIFVSELGKLRKSLKQNKAICCSPPANERASCSIPLYQILINRWKYWSPHSAGWQFPVPCPGFPRQSVTRLSTAVRFLGRWSRVSLAYRRSSPSSTHFLAANLVSILLQHHSLTQGPIDPLLIMPVLPVISSVPQCCLLELEEPCPHVG